MAEGIVKECVSYLDDEWKNNRMEGDKKSMLFFSFFSLPLRISVIGRTGSGCIPPEDF